MNSSGEQSWTVVVFRDLHPEDTMNLEILSLARSCFFSMRGDGSRDVPSALYANKANLWDLSLARFAKD